MSSTQRITVGAVLAAFGGFGIALVAILGFGDLPAGWHVAIAFALGVAAGVGSVLALAGVRELNK